MIFWFLKSKKIFESENILQFSDSKYIFNGFMTENSLKTNYILSKVFWANIESMKNTLII